MDPAAVEKLLVDLRRGAVGVAHALQKLRGLPVDEALAFATLDTHRALRQGFPEVVLGTGKTGAQIAAIVKRLRGHGQSILVTRLDAAKAPAVKRAAPRGRYDPVSRTFSWRRTPPREGATRPVVVCCAGTSDIPVAEEAAVTAEVMGEPVERVTDVGVAGVHRVLRRRETLARAGALVVVAGMEGALPSVVAGLVERPVIAVPTSVGYGAAFGGLAALLGMLNSCAPNVTVVNIDNGFAAGFNAALINRGG